MKQTTYEIEDGQKKPEGKTYPPSKFPKELELLDGFIWREGEKPLTKEDIFKHDPVLK